MLCCPECRSRMTYDLLKTGKPLRIVDGAAEPVVASGSLCAHTIWHGFNCPRRDGTIEIDSKDRSNPSEIERAKSSRADYKLHWPQTQTSAIFLFPELVSQLVGQSWMTAPDRPTIVLACRILHSC